MGFPCTSACRLAMLETAWTISAKSYVVTERENESWLPRHTIGGFVFS